MRFGRMGFVALGMPLLMAAAEPPASGGWQSAPTADAAFVPAANAPVLRRELPSATPPLRTVPPADAVPVATPPLRSETSAGPPPIASAPPLRIAPSADPPRPGAAPLRSEPARSYGPQRVNFAEGVTAAFDIPYQALPGFRPLTLDVYQPRPRAAPLPLVVFVHGGGFQGGDSRHAGTFEDFPRELAALAARGYVVASVNYRLSGEARFPAAVQDVKAAIRWLAGRAETYGIDATRIAVWGMGAGGQLAALTGVTCGVGMFEPEAAAGGSDCVQAVIDWSGATDLNTLVADNGAAGNGAAGNGKAVPAGGFTPPPTSDSGAFLGCEPANCPPVMARLASPLGYVKATSPPFLIQHGGADTSISPKQAQKFHDALQAAGVHAQLVIYPGIGQEFRKGGAPDPATNAQALQQVAAFLAATFPYAPLNAPATAKVAPAMRRTVQN